MRYLVVITLVILLSIFLICFSESLEKEEDVSVEPNEWVLSDFLITQMEIRQQGQIEIFELQQTIAKEERLYQKELIKEAVREVLDEYNERKN